MSSDRISRIELFAFNNRPSFAYRPVRSGSSYLVLRLTCGEQISYGVCVVSMNGKAIDLIKWGAFLISIQHSSLEELVKAVRLHGQEWTTSQLILLQSALAGLHQARTEIAIGLGHKLQGMAVLHSSGSVRYPIIRRTKDFNLSRLIDESISYYSILL